MLQDFLSSRPSAAATRAPQTSAAPSRALDFQPLFSARPAEATLNIVSSRIEAPSETEELEAPEIELVQDNGRIRRIIVTCTCCKTIEIECEY